MVQSAILKSSIPCKNYLTKFTLPDGGHYEIMYDFVIKNEDGSSLKSGSTLTLHNEAIVHTSGGDKTDESSKTTYTIQESEVTTRVGQNFEIVKVDIGNQSINDLNAEFKLAKFDKLMQTTAAVSGSMRMHSGIKPSQPVLHRICRIPCMRLFMMKD